MNPPSYVVLFRTHFWDGFAQTMAAHLSSRVGRGDFVVLADETWQSMDIRGYPKLSHTADFSSIGLNVNTPHKEKYMWHNGDFPLYKALIDMPGYDYYCVVEYDVVFNEFFDGMIEALAERRVEMVGYRLRQAPDNIAAQVRAYYRNTNSLLPCVLIASRRAAEYLYQQRCHIASIHARNPEFGWPFCEGFLGAAITDRPDIAYADLAQFGDVSRYEFWPPTLYSPSLTRETKSFIHPVLDPARFVGSRVRHGADEFFVTGSPMQRDLEQVDPAVFVPILRDFLSGRREHDRLSQLECYARERGL
jgi:hypothetical protein